MLAPRQLPALKPEAESIDAGCGRRQNLALLLAAVAISAPWAALFSQLRFIWSVHDQYSYAWSVPWLAAVLFILRWRDRPPAEPAIHSGWLIFALLALLPLRLGEEATPEWSVANWSLALATLAAYLAFLFRAGGGNWLRWFAYPGLFALSAVPWPQRFELSLTNRLMQLVAQGTVECVTWFSVPAIREGNLIRLPTGYLSIEEACSGVSSLQSAMMITLFLGELYRLPAARRIVLICSGLALAVAGNFLRNILLCAIAARSGIPAVDVWHDPAGFGILVFVLVGACLLARCLHPERSISPSSVAPPRFPPFLAVGVLLWVFAVEVGVALWYRSHEGAPRGWDWSVRWPREARDYHETAIENRFQRVLLCSDGRAAAWQGSDGAAWKLYWLRWNPGRSAAQSARVHRPETCLQGSGSVLREDLGSRPLSLGGLVFPFRAYSFARGNHSFFVFFCLCEQGISDLITPGLRQDWSGWSRLQRAFTGQRNPGQQSLEFLVEGYARPEEAEASLARCLADLIQPNSVRGDLETK